MNTNPTSTQALVQRVVVCDDTRDLRDLLTLELQFHPGMELVGEACNGLEAVRLAAELRPDVLLLDVEMPVLGGLDALPRILEVSPTTKVIVLSASLSHQMAPQALAGGATAYVEKGVSSFEIIKHIEALCGVVPQETVLDHTSQVETADSAEEIRSLNERLTAMVDELEGFAYSVSHDLRAPLRAMDGFSRILMEDHAHELSDDARRKLEIIVKNSQKMGTLIDELLDFSRLGRTEMVKRPVDTRALLTDVLEDLLLLETERKVDITVGELPPCEADHVLLRQVFVNLLSNALKFTAKNPEAQIEAGCRDVDGTNVYFVRDNGAGFDQSYAGKLFGVFQRLHSADEFEGTGVGLALVQRIVRRHGGDVWGEGEVGVGATFYFALDGGIRHD